MKTEYSRKYLLIFSALLIGYQYFGFVIEGNVPYTEITISSQANIPIVLSLLVVFFGIQFAYYWFTQKKEGRSYFELWSSIPIALIAITPVSYGYLSEYGIDWRVITSSVLIFALGGLLAIATYFLISIAFSIRSNREMRAMGLGRLPSASKALLLSSLVLLLLTIPIIYLLFRYGELLPVPVNHYWLVIFISPTLIFNFDTFINLIMCLGPSSIREKALNNLRRFRRAMDLHEMHYQYIGVEKPSEYELPAICLLAKSGSIVELEQQLSSGVDPDIQDARGWSPLMWAAAEGHSTTVNLLLDHGADPNTINYLGRSAVMYASNYGYYEIVQVLVEKGTILNPSGEFSDHPALSAAARHGHLKIVKLLVEYGADPLHRNEEGKSALDFAMEAGHGEVAKYLRNVLLQLDETRPEDKSSLVKNIGWIRKKPEN